MTSSSSNDITDSPQIIAFKRLRIACPNLNVSVEHYRLLLGSDPLWEGWVELQERSTSCRSVWFSTQNTTLELLELPVEQASIIGIVFETEHAFHLPDRSGRGLWLTFEPRERSVACKEISLPADIKKKPERNNASISRVDHIVIYTHSADDSIRLFGKEGLGIRLALDKDVPEWGGRMLFFRAGKLTLEVIQPTKTFSGSDYFWGIAYQVDDIKAVHQRLRDAGVSLSEIREGRKDGTYVATVKSHQLGIPTLLVQP